MPEPVNPSVEKIAEGHRQVQASMQVDLEQLRGCRDGASKLYNQFLTDHETLQRYGFAMAPKFLQMMYHAQNALRGLEMSITAYEGLQANNSVLLPENRRK